MKEAAVTKYIMLEEAKLNVLGMRNNVGMAKFIDDYGQTRVVNYGLMNESPNQNKVIKSSDRILINPVWCYRDHIGWGWIGQFGAAEIKRTGWQFDQADQHSVAQAAFHSIVRQYGGVAGFVTSPEDFRRMLGK